jgi:plastocyanin
VCRAIPQGETSTVRRAAASVAIAVSLIVPAWPTAAHAATVSVDVRDFAFASPNVAVAPGGAVSWHVSGTAPHSITSNDGTTFDSAPTCSSGNTAACSTQGLTFSHTFPSAGTFAYHCRIHSSMTGTVVVDGTPPAAVSNLKATRGTSRVALSWTNPSSDVGSIVVRKKPGTTPPSSPTDGVGVMNKLASSVLATHLTNGTTYAFAVFARDDAGNYSPAATITAKPMVITTISEKRAATTVKYGRSVRVYGYLKSADTHIILGGRKVNIYYRRRGESAFHFLRTLTTSSTTGGYTFTHVPLVTTYYKARHLATSTSLTSTSPSLPVGVRPLIGAGVSSTVVERDSDVTIAGKLIPAHEGSRMQLQRYGSSGWATVASRYLDSAGNAVFTLHPTVLGRYRYRLYHAADVDHLSSASPSLYFTVYERTLREGMSGSDVTAMQQRLASLSYDPGAINGYFGYETLHAVYAFQKVNGLPRDGAVGVSVRSRLAHPAAPHLRYPRSGYSVEVDKTKQILMYAYNGVVKRTVDVSTGSGKAYYQDGQRNIAVTPEGAFHIYRKIDGMRTSKLGELWRPAYFYGGYAIHGNSSVPTYPASHGCVRVPNPVQDRLFNLLTIGTPVYVYH